MAFLSTTFIFFKRGKFSLVFYTSCNDIFISTVDPESSELPEIRWIFRKVVLEVIIPFLLRGKSDGVSNEKPNKRSRKKLT